MSDRPTSIRLHGVTWQIRSMTRIEFLTEERDNLIGQCKHDITTLQVSSESPINRQRAVLWHEIVHAVEGDAGLDFPETAIRAMASGLFSALRDNPDVTKWILEET